MGVPGIDKLLALHWCSVSRWLTKERNYIHRRKTLFNHSTYEKTNSSGRHFAQRVRGRVLPPVFHGFVPRAGLDRPFGREIILGPPAVRGPGVDPGGGLGVHDRSCFLWAQGAAVSPPYLAFIRFGRQR